MSYEKFKPKFPVNPFAGVEQTSTTAREPWTLDADALPLPSILQHERRVILVIGQLTAAALSPLFASRHLASSLIIIASHRPPALPFDTHPSVYILRLRTPLSVADAGATRLIEILEWALQVARLWRRSGGPKKQELMEEVSPASESVPLGQSYGRLRYSIAGDAQPNQMAASSVTSIAPSTSKRTRRLSLFKRQSSLPLMPDPSSAKPFDALLHFLPADVPDKARLKAMILVTTLTRPYLAVPPTRARSTRFYSESSSKLSSSSKSGKRWSFFRSTSNVTSPLNSSSTLSVSSQSKSTTDLTEGSRNRHRPLTNLALLRARRSRLIHLMSSAPAPMKASGSSVTSATARHPVSNPNLSTQTPAQAHLIRNIEAFLLSFCFSVSPELPTPIAGFAASDADCGKARPYVLPSIALAEVLQVQSRDDKNEIDGEGEESGIKPRTEWTLAELILSGALESEAESRLSAGLRSDTDRKSSESESDKGKGRQKDAENAIENNIAWMAHRAWIGSLRDIVVTHSTSVMRMEKAHIVSPRSSSQPLLPSRSYLGPHPSQSRIPSQPQTQALPPSQRLSYLKPVQNLSRSDPVRTTQFPTSKSPPRAALYVDTKRRRDSKKHGYQSLAIEKRLPTPPEDENEDEEVEEEYGLEAEEVDSTISNATSCTRSPYPDDDNSERDMTPRASEWKNSGVVYGQARRHSSEKAGSYDHASEGHHRRHDSYSRSGVASPSSGYPSTSSSSTSTSSTITRTNTHPHHRTSRRHLYQSEQARSRRQVYMHIEEEEDAYRESDKTQQQREKEDMASGNLPTPPDSEEASFEGLVPDPVVLSASASILASTPSAQSVRERQRRYAGADASRNRASPTKRERTPSREERKRERVSDAESHSPDKERERRKRAYSQPSRPPPPIPSASPTLTIDERTPSRRSKTKPKERKCRISKDIPPLPLLQDATSIPKSISRSKPIMERRITDVSAILNKPLRPDLKRSPASASSPSSDERERERERRHAKLEERSRKLEIRKNRNGTSSSESRDRGASVIKRIPVPAMEDVLPPLPRSSASALPSTSRSSLPQSQQHHQQHNVRWKFWKGDVGTGPTVNA
ncbi:hypothetical protein ACEPAG_8602 [Sanghuangporus baumii]